MTALNVHELADIQGGSIVDTLDAACAVVGVGALFIPGAQLPGAFCAGYGAGRVIGSWF
jgi:hypothetical protein